MSDDQNIIDDEMAEITAGLVEVAEIERLKEDTNKKKAILDNRRTNFQYDKSNRDAEDLKKIKEADFNYLTDKQIEDIQNEHDEYMKASKSSMPFIDVTFNKAVPFFRRNFITVCARPGEGKSTCTANIAHMLMQAKNPETGKHCRVLIITNEEAASDVYNRITCLAKGWHYINHKNFTPEQIKLMRDGIKVWAKTGRITVIDDNYNNAKGTTTTIEGIEAIFENLLRSYEKDSTQMYDAIIIDYYQKVSMSKNNIAIKPFDAQEIFVNLIDKYKNLYPAPIVVLAQIKRESEESSYEERIQGRKTISNSSTFVVEMKPDRDLSMTLWKVHKSRFTPEVIGKGISTGYENGRFVPYTDEFKLKIQTRNDNAASKEQDRQIGLPDVFTKEDEDDGE